MSTQRLATKRAVRARERVHYLDWLRVLAVLGVFLYHAGHPFDTTGWHVKNEDQTGALTVVMDFLGLWGLPLFFLVAGAGSVLALRWRTPARYLRERVQRLLVPLVVGYLLLSPVQSFIEETHFRRWSGSFPSFLPAFFGRVRDELLEAGFPPGPLVVGWPYHLWFLAFLLWFSLLGLPLLLWLRGPGGRRLSAGLGRMAERRGAILLLALPMALLNVAVRGLPGEDHGWSEFYYYFGFFLAGGVVLSDDRLARAVRRDLLPALSLGIAGLLVLLAGDAVGFFEAWDGRTYSWTYAWMAALFTVQAWGWVVSALSLGMRARSLDRPPPRTVSAAAMPFFLLHQPVILAIAFPVVRWDAGIPLKLAVVLLGSFAVSAALAVAVTRLRHVSALFGVKPVGQRGPAGRRGDHRP